MNFMLFVVLTITICGITGPVQNLVSMNCQCSSVETLAVTYHTASIWLASHATLHKTSLIVISNLTTLETVLLERRKYSEVL